MNYDWNTEANKTQEHNNTPLPDGTHNVVIKKVVFGRKDGTPFTNKTGDPQIMLVFADDQGREVMQMYPLSNSEGWRLAQIMRARGADLTRMQAAGVTPESFLDPTFAEKNLVGHGLTIEVKAREWQGRTYYNVNPIARQPGGDAAQTGPKLQEADIPF